MHGVDDTADLHKRLHTVYHALGHMAIDHHKHQKQFYIAIKRFPLLDPQFCPLPRCTHPVSLLF